jgi:hypothetical protein
MPALAPTLVVASLYGLDKLKETLLTYLPVLSCR